MLQFILSVPKMRKILTLSIHEEILEKLDKIRGLIPRSTYVQWLITEAERKGARVIIKSSKK